ncbi:hypothetical protein ACIBCN_18765 [Nocardia sp. NPDC051052]
MTGTTPHLGEEVKPMLTVAADLLKLLFDLLPIVGPLFGSA